MKTLTDGNFEHEVATVEAAVVMFSAPWAGPCNLARPAFAAAHGRYGNQITFGEFHLDDNPNVPQKYGVRQVPLFVFFSAGKPVRYITGAVPEDVLLTACEKILP
jgi:thioredoxin 1